MSVDIEATARDMALRWLSSLPDSKGLLSHPHLTAPDLLSPKGCEWEPFAKMLNTMSEAFGAETVAAGVASTTFDIPDYQLVLNTLATAASPRALYLFFAKTGAKSNPGIQSTWLKAPEGQLRLQVRVRQPNPTPCPAYFFTTAHVLRQLPVKLLKTAEPHVHLETDGVEGLFTIHLPPSRTLLNRLRRTWNALLGQDPMAEMLFIEQTDSLNKTQQLREVHLDLERRVQERTEELARLNAELKAMTINKSRHIANMSHELRTPLNAIIGYSELLNEEVHATENLQMQADLSRITTAAGYLLSLVNNVLDLSKIEAGQLEVHLADVELHETVNEVCTALAPLFDKNRNELIVEVGPGSVRADPQHLRQILANLLGNATKFTQDGTITVSMEAEGEHILLHITDTGLGMSPETLGFIFTAYARASFSDAKAFEGTGLGLPIAHELAEQMSGTLTVTSVLGSGSTFTLSLPATPS